jgi:regulator of sigma E protease
MSEAFAYFVDSRAFYLVTAAFVLGVIIVLHELGHFLVAKLFKIKVETFSVGFGPRLFGFKYGETDYRISVLPLGGYVKMAGENPGDTITGDPREFMSKPKWQRFLVAAAGPAMNLILAVGLLAGLFMYGTEVLASMNSIAIVGYVEPGAQADQAGIRSGDRIVSFVGKELPSWDQVRNRIIINPNEKLPVTVEREGKHVDLTLTAPPLPANPSDIGIAVAGMAPLNPVIVKEVYDTTGGDGTNKCTPNVPGPAKQAGIEVNDEIVAVDGIDVKSSGRNVPSILKSTEKQTVPITVLRKGETKEFRVTPVTVTCEGQETRRMIAILIPPPTVPIKLGFVDAVKLSVDKNYENATNIKDVLVNLVRRTLPLGTLEGPIGIARISGEAARVGPSALIAVMAMISLNLGLLNLLPIPVLDGGVMLLIAIEGLVRRELSLRVKERIVQVSVVALLMLTAFVIYNDVVKMLPSGTP